MYLNRISTIIFAIILVSGCATLPHPTVEQATTEQAKEPSLQEKCKSKRSVIGIFIKENKLKYLEISSVIKNSPAEKAQLRSGDVITKANGTPIKSRYDFLKLLDEIPPGKSIDLTIRRHSSVIEKTVLVQEGFIYHDAKALQTILASGKAVRLAILVVDVDSKLPIPAKKQNWRNKTSSDVFSTLTGELLFTYQGEKNLLIYDKVKTEQIMQEVSFQRTGTVSDNDTIKLGNMHGATHLLLVDFSLQPPSFPFLEFMYVENRRLIEVKSGKVVAAAACRGGK
jgi:membrane-associated protease RseP (regulator of RpoE activity)